MNKDFKIYQEGERLVIERLTYPRFKAVINFDNPLSDLDEIQLLEEVRDAKVIARAMREAGDFMLTHKKPSP